MNKNKILSLFEEWNNALQTGDPSKVTKLYATNAILLPTVSNLVRHSHQEIEDYVVHFLAKGPVGLIDEANIRIIDNLAINSGLYTFKFADESSVQARFTFVYSYNGDVWKIIEHHSSRLPE